MGVWRMTGFYGFPERSRRNASWDLLHTLACQSPLPWVVVGDFNDLLFQHEKRGGNPHPDNLLRGFGEAVEDCGLTQLPLHGYQFTWERGRGTLDWMEEKLDKVLAGAEWCHILPEAAVSNITTRNSDHSAIFLGVREHMQAQRHSRRHFKFEMAWVYGEGCRRQVEEAWREGRDAGLMNCLRLYGDRLLRYGGDHFHKFGEKINTLRKRQLLFKGQLDPYSLGEYQRVETELCRLEAQEDAFWRQRAKQHWLRGADANTKFFHSQEEVHVALSSMFPDKAPGPNGMNLGFYQHYWEVVGTDVTAFVLQCLNECSFPAGLNDTNVVLIPKKNSPEKVSNLRPIALCNVVYKIMAKMIANRMKPLLGDVISDSQSAFIPNRLITDNILIAAEVGHYLNRKQCGAVGWGALKLDMAKAYDRVEWSFLRKMLLAIGFSVEWVDLVMLCVTTVSYNFLVNGTNAGQVTPTRGIRQGDPLSPYLFIICAEGLSLLLQQAEARGDFHGCRVARGAPPVSHLFFADDSLLFFNANA
ncbi:uncharacterized protein LOC116010151 [Ipomoea triloba]|uniref:uncharacterized protein LOC116010151 n=1 Tax=Ipomoea triloba TaxID=35885 RepID=UPI00125E8BB3|nr:uncharacterized protein LOC116010151 [Ipomoea triloba]